MGSVEAKSGPSYVKHSIVLLRSGFTIEKVEEPLGIVAASYSK